MGAPGKRLYYSSFLRKTKAKPAKGELGRKTPPSQRWEGGKMAALASSLIRQKRAVKDDQANRPVANKRKPCPKSNKSLCQKQILVLISKVRLCGGRKGRNEKRPGESMLSFSSFSAWSSSHYNILGHLARNESWLNEWNAWKFREWALYLKKKIKYKFNLIYKIKQFNLLSSCQYFKSNWINLECFGQSESCQSIFSYDLVPFCLLWIWNDWSI